MPIPSAPTPIDGQGFTYGEPVERQRAAKILDPYSGEATAYDWNSVDSLDIPGWGIDDSRSSEPLEVGRDAVITDYVLYRPNAADVLAGDRVVVRGQVCEVVGQPAFWRNPFTGWNAGFVVRANVTEG